MDVTEIATIPGFVEGVARDYGRIDALINNAGFAVAGFAEDIKLEELRTQFETNFFGPVAPTKAVLPTMRKQRSGHIIMISSIGGLTGAVTISSYSASKFALEGWTETLRLEVNALGIKVVLIEPGSFQTDIWTRGAVMGEKAVTEDIAEFSAQLENAGACGCAPQARPYRSSETDRLGHAGSESETALSRGQRRQDAAGVEAHPAVEVE